MIFSKNIIHCDLKLENILLVNDTIDEEPEQATQVLQDNRFRHRPPFRVRILYIVCNVLFLVHIEKSQ
jgi:serine/threonine protein kinase